MERSGLGMGGIGMVWYRYGYGYGWYRSRGMFQQVWNTRVCTGVLELYHKHRMPRLVQEQWGIYDT